MEFNEYFIYGSVKYAHIVGRDYEIGPSSGQYGDIYVYLLKLNDSKDSVIHKAKISIDAGEFKDKDDVEFVESARIGDTVQIKIIGEQNAKILKLGDLEVNKSINFFGKLGRWTIILVLITIGNFLIYKVYKTVQTKTTIN